MAQTLSEMGTQQSHCCGWPLTVDPLPLCTWGALSCLGDFFLSALSSSLPSL